MSEPVNYSNSHKNKAKAAAEKDKKVERVVTGEAVVREKSNLQKIKGIFFTGSFKTSVLNVLSEVVLPAVRNTVAEGGKSTIDKMVYGERRTPRPSTRTSYSTPFSRIQYASRLGPSLPDQGPRAMLAGSREASDVIIPTREEAQLVLERLNDLVDQYETASLADFYDLCGLSASHTDNKHGWTNLRSATIQTTRDGFFLNLPPLEVL